MQRRNKFKGYLSILQPLESPYEKMTALFSPEDTELPLYEDSHQGTFLKGLQDSVVSSEWDISAVFYK